MKVSLFVLLLLPSLAFGATLEGVLKINNGKQWVYISTTLDSKTVGCAYATQDTLTGSALQNFAISQGDRCKKQVRREQYRLAPNLKTIAAWDAWIAAGHKIQTCSGNPEVCVDEVIPKKPFKGKHPKSIGYKAQYGAANSTIEKLDIIAEFLGLK